MPPPTLQSTVPGRTVARCACPCPRSAGPRSLTSALASHPSQRFVPKGLEYRSHILHAHAESLDGLLNLITETLLNAAGLDTAVFKSTVDGQPLPPDHPFHPDNQAKLAKNKRQQLVDASQQEQQQQQQEQQQQQVDGEQPQPQPQHPHEHEFTQATEGDDHQFIAESAYTHGHDEDLAHDEFVHHPSAGVGGPSGAPSAGAGGEQQHDLSEFQHDLQQHLHHGGGPSDLDGNIIAQVMASYNASREADLQAQAGGGGAGSVPQQQQHQQSSSALSIDSSLGAGIMSILRRNGGVGGVPAHLGGGHHHLFQGTQDAGMEYVNSSAIDPSIDPTLAGPSGMAAFPPQAAPQSQQALVPPFPVDSTSGDGSGTQHSAPAAADATKTTGRSGSALPSTRKKPYDRPETPGGSAPASSSTSTPRGPRKCKRCVQFDVEGAASCPGRHIRANCNLNERVAQGKVILPLAAPSALAASAPSSSSSIPGAPGWDPTTSSFVDQPPSPGAQPQADVLDPAIAGPSTSVGAGGAPPAVVPHPLYVLPTSTGEPRKARTCKVCRLHGRDGKDCHGRGDRKKCADYDADEDAAGAYNRKKGGAKSGAGGSGSGGGDADGSQLGQEGGDGGDGTARDSDDEADSSIGGGGGAGGADEQSAGVEPDATTAYLADDDVVVAAGADGAHHGHHHHADDVDDLQQYVPLGSGHGHGHGHEMDTLHHHSHHHLHLQHLQHDDVDDGQRPADDDLVDPAEEYVVGDQDDQAGA